MKALLPLAYWLLLPLYKLVLLATGDKGRRLDADPGASTYWLDE